MKKLKKKDTIIVLISIFILLSISVINYTVLPVSATHFNTVIKKLPIYCVDTNENKLSISFDAAWGADKTEEIMNICDSYNVKATFFLVGFWVENYKEMVKKIYNRGFEIGLHSNTHPDMVKLSKQEMKDELNTNIELIKDLTGITPKLFRPPYGSYNNNLIEVCDELGLKCIQWSVDSLDWKGLSASELAGRVTSKAKNGSIILCHNNSDNILNGLKMILEFFKTNNKNLIPIGDLIYYDNYTINNQGTQIKI